MNWSHMRANVDSPKSSSSFGFRIKQHRFFGLSASRSLDYLAIPYWTIDLRIRLGATLHTTPNLCYSQMMQENLTVGSGSRPVKRDDL